MAIWKQLKPRWYLLLAIPVLFFFVKTMWSAPVPDPLAGLPDLPVVVKPTAFISVQLNAPVRLESNGRPIDIGELSSFAHAGPWLADLDQDGDRDLLVGDFGSFWLFENEVDNQSPRYASGVKLQAGGKDATIPVY